MPLPGLIVPMRGAVASGGTPAVISGATGTAIGNMTGGGGLAAGFDGVTSQSYSAGSFRAADTGNTIGKNWGSNKTITQADIWCPNNVRFNGSGGQASGLLFTLYGSNSSLSGGVSLGTFTGSQTGLSQKVTITATDTSTSYPYHWVSCDVTSLLGGGFYLAEVEFTGY